MKIASMFSVPLHAISRGKNWGYGDACAPEDRYVIVDLRRMNRIREVNVELGYAVIEPGVSQGQMYEHIRDNNLPLLLDVTGAGPDASIVGNILQRGFGHTPYGDRFRHTCGFEVVLADGSLINTGLAKFDNAAASCVFQCGAGPLIDGLFTQSNYGLVISACIWLMPRPEVLEGFAIKVEKQEQLGELITALRRLKINGTLRSAVHIANDVRVLSSQPEHLRESGRRKEPLSIGSRQILRKQSGVGAWNMLGGIYTSRHEIRGVRKEVRAAFKAVAPVRFFRRQTLERMSNLLNRVPTIKWVRQRRELVQCLSTPFELLEGIPNPAHLYGAFWRSSAGAAVAGDLRNAGLIWISPILPITEQHTKQVVELAETILIGHGFDPLMTVTSINERALCCVISINFDKSDCQEATRAAQCSRQLRDSLQSNGYYVYRQSIC